MPRAVRRPSALIKTIQLGDTEFIDDQWYRDHHSSSSLSRNSLTTLLPPGATPAHFAITSSHRAQPISASRTAGAVPASCVNVIHSSSSSHPFQSLHFGHLCTVYCIVILLRFSTEVQQWANVLNGLGPPPDLDSRCAVHPGQYRHALF